MKRDSFGTTPKAYRDLPLLWKLQIPFVVMILLVGAVGAFLIVRDLSTRATSTLAADLLRSSVSARAQVFTRELYLLESANLTANLEGMSAAVQTGDATTVDDLLQTVLALKPDLSLVAALVPGQAPIVSYIHGAPSPAEERVPIDAPFILQAFSDPAGTRRAGMLTIAGTQMLVIAAPVCTTLDVCGPSGVAVVGFDLNTLVGELDASLTTGDRNGGVVLFADDGRPLASRGLAPTTPSAVTLQGEDLLRRTDTVDGVETHTLYAPLILNGQPQGQLAVSLPTEPAFDVVDDAATRLLFLMLAALVGIVAIGIGVTRLVLGQVRPLMKINARLGAGDLTARAPVTSGDEIGELAAGLNLMAEQLQASHETMENRVQQRTSEVQRLLEERTQFFASLSHELRTPLAVILSEAGMLVEDSAGEARESAGAIKQSAAQLLTSVNDILEFARAEAGRLRVEPAPLDLHEFFDDLGPVIRALGSRGEVETGIRIDQDLPAVMADSVRLREIVLNLVDNAVKYTPAHGRLAVSGHAAGPFMELRFADTGVGIPADVGETIFDPFSRVDGTSPRPGMSSTGLGLALTRRLVEAHQGSITYTSEEGRGSTFVVRLPTASQPVVHQGWAPPEPHRVNGAIR